MPPSHFSTDGRPYELTIQGYLLDSIAIGRPCLSSQEFRHDRCFIARAGLDAYLVEIFTEEEFDGHDLSARAGDVRIFDLTETLRERVMPSSTVTMVIPKGLVDRHWNARIPVNGLVVPGHTALGQLLGAHLVTLAEAMPGIATDDASVIAEMTAQMVASCFAHYAGDGDSTHGPPQDVLFDRVMHHIRANLSSPDLSPDSIGAALKVSRAHLYRAFRDKGGVARCIFDQRLRWAFVELTSPANQADTIGAIAFRCGFASDSHFTRLFRETFGKLPSEIREALLAVPGIESEAILPL